jgi:hypothetical protein
MAVFVPQRMQAAPPQQIFQGDQAPLSARRDAPPDTTNYTRAAIAEDRAPKGQKALPNVLTPTLFVTDAVVSNTNPALQNTDVAGDSEPSIAINPLNTNQISMTAFSGGWGANAVIWNSSDGGTTWSRQATIPRPPNAPGTNGQCPCDQDIDYGRGNLLEGTFLSFNPTDVYTGITSDPTNSASWNWKTTAGTADKTNAVGAGNTDQPWTLTNRDTAVAAQDNIYVAYDNFAVNPIGMRIAVSLGVNPPNFTRDNQSGTSGGPGIINPGHRLAVDPRNGWVYDLFQNSTGGSPSDWAATYRLNRSTDGGQTWTLNGSGTGIQVAAANSTQGIGPTTTFDVNGNCVAPQPNNLFKFGTVNALLGGVDHAAVDPNNGDVYYVYGNRDGGTGNNRISIIRLTDNGGGGLNIGASNFVTGQVQAALPSVAVASNGVVGVLYTQYDGVSGGFPSFSAHLAMSENQGVTFQDFVLENFLSPSADNNNCRQRVLGDYQQMKAVGNTFYGVFTGNGVPFGRTTSNLDPIFFKVQAACSVACPANIIQPNDPNQCGAVVTYPAPVLTSCAGTVTCAPASGSFFPVGTTTVTCTTAPEGASCQFTIKVNDTQFPTITCPGSIARFTDSGQLGATVNPGTPVALDNCSVSITSVRSDGKALNALYPVGVTVIIWTATDVGGNKASCGQSIVVMVPSGQQRKKIP